MADSVKRSEYLTRWGQLKTERATWWAHWRELTDFFLPRNGRYFVQDRNKGWKRHNNLYDSASLRAVNVLSAGMMSGMTSPARPWFRLATPDPEMMKYHPVRIWLDDVTKLLHTVFQKSNTYRALHSIYRELGVFGTASSIVVPDFRTIVHHTPLTIGEYCIATNGRGEVDTLYREFEKTVGQMVKEFGRENCSTTVQNLYDRGSLDQWVRVVHAVEPRGDRDPSRKDSKNMAFRSVYFELGADEGKYLSEGGYKRFPAVAPRWDIAGGDIYGNSPGMEALGDVKQLQQEQLRKAQGIDFQTNPPLQAPTSLKNRDVQRMPGGITFTDMAGPGSKIESLFNVNLRLDHLLVDIQDVRERINGAFYADLFLMLSNQTDARMTATEVAERHEEKLLMLGPVLERLQNELLTPLVDTAFDAVMAAGLVPPPPQELQGVDISVEMVSMLAQAQRAVATNSIDRFVGSLGAVAQFRPDVLDRLDVDHWADTYADALGVDPKLLVPMDKVDELRAQRAQQAQQAQQAAQMNMAADTAHKMAGTDTSGQNALTDATAAFQGYT